MLRLIKLFKLSVICVTSKVYFLLDISLDLNSSSYEPYQIPTRNIIICINGLQLTVVFKNLITNINIRVSNLTLSKNIIEKSASKYNNALANNVFNDKLIYKPSNVNHNNNRSNRPRKMVWFTPTFYLNVKTNIGKRSLLLQDKYFPEYHRYRKIFN